MKNVAKKFFLALVVSGAATSAFAGSDGDYIGGLIKIVDNITSKQNVSLQGSGSVTTGHMQAEANSSCHTSSGSVCQNFAGGSINQNAAKGSDTTQLALGGAQSANFKATQGGSASGKSTNQNAAAYAANQNAEHGGN